VLALHRSGMNGLVKLALIALVVIVCAAGLSFCAEGLAGCGHARSMGAGLSRSLQRLMRKLKSVCRTAVDLLLLSLGATTGTVGAPMPWLAFGPALQRVLPLRI